MSWHFLQGGVAACWLRNSLDGAPLPLLRLMPERVRSFLIDSVTESSGSFQSGMTSPPLMQGHSKDALTLSLEGFHAKTLANAELAQVSRDNEVVYGGKWHESFAKLDPITLLWKTAQCSLLEDLEQSLETWPEWGSMRNGECFELPVLEQPTIERGFTWLLTPTAQSWKAWTFRNPLALIRKNHADGNLQEQLMRLYQRMTTPRCQEILMMWPEGWTDSKPLAMDGFQRWRQEQYVY